MYINQSRTSWARRGPNDGSIHCILIDLQASEAVAHICRATMERVSLERKKSWHKWWVVGQTWTRRHTRKCVKKGQTAFHYSIGTAPGQTVGIGNETSFTTGHWKTKADKQWFEYATGTNRCSVKFTITVNRQSGRFRYRRDFWSSADLWNRCLESELMKHERIYCDDIQ